MFEVTEENYLQFLTYHGRSRDNCLRVIEQYDNPESRKLGSVRLWVDASKMFLKMENKNGH